MTPPSERTANALCELREISGGVKNAFGQHPCSTRAHTHGPSVPFLLASIRFAVEPKFGDISLRFYTAEHFEAIRARRCENINFFLTMFHCSRGRLPRFEELTGEPKLCIVIILNALTASRMEIPCCTSIHYFDEKGRCGREGDLQT